MFGSDSFRKEPGEGVKTDYRVGSLSESEAVLCGQRVRRQGDVLLVGQDEAIEEVAEIKLEGQQPEQGRCLQPSVAH